ncbi:MAG TPA: DUF4382 domain-containing protein [Anaeromyxobacteraceae bacterium]|jgi:hypothetical protein|nr:DUF4382 domain-containing protein [Anaeromyxobacteraceae bacterium]
MRAIRSILLAAPLAILAACGGSSAPAAGQTGSVNLLLSDATTEDWATIGVKLLAVSLQPQGGGTPVQVYAAPSPAPVVNLVQLDQLGEILGNVQVPAGTYTGAVLTVAANPGDVQLVVSADPATGFPLPAGTQVASSQIQIQGAKGTAGILTVPVSVKLASPLVVTASQSNALDLEFDLGHPAFIVEHVTPTSTTPVWAVNFDGPVRHRPGELARLVLRHLYATVTAVSADGASLTVTKDFPARPITTPETAIATSQSLTILADATNGTLFYDLDARTSATVKSFSSVAATLSGKYVRVAARYQQDGTLVAVRVWASSSFNGVWLSPEGHVLHVDGTNDVLTVGGEDGKPIALAVDANTRFFFRAPQNALADATPIATGPTFLSNVKRGFKVHASVVDPLASPLVAQTVDIEIARFDGVITNSTTAGFDYTHYFATSTDNYVAFPLGYVSAATPNGKDPLSGAALTGFKWWNFAYPTLLHSGASAVTDYVAATGGQVSFGGTVAPLKLRGASYAAWNDPATPAAWSALFTVLEPISVPLGKVSSAFAPSATGGTFAMTVTGGANPVTVDLTSTAGSATLVYQVDRTNNVVTVSAQDLASASVFANVSGALAAGVPVKVFGVPNPDGSIQADVLFYFTGVTP